jgi:hypothetical protein
VPEDDGPLETRSRFSNQRSQHCRGRRVSSLLRAGNTIYATSDHICRSDWLARSAATAAIEQRFVAHHIAPPPPSRFSVASPLQRRLDTAQHGYGPDNDAAARRRRHGATPAPLAPRRRGLCTQRHRQPAPRFPVGVPRRPRHRARLVEYRCADCAARRGLVSLLPWRRRIHHTNVPVTRGARTRRGGGHPLKAGVTFPNLDSLADPATAAYSIQPASVVREVYYGVSEILERHSRTGFHEDFGETAARLSATVERFDEEPLADDRTMPLRGIGRGLTLATQFVAPNNASLPCELETSLACRGFSTVDYGEEGRRCLSTAKLAPGLKRDETRCSCAKCRTPPLFVPIRGCTDALVTRVKESKLVVRAGTVATHVCREALLCRGFIFLRLCRCFASSQLHCALIATVAKETGLNDNGYLIGGDAPRRWLKLSLMALKEQVFKHKSPMPRRPGSLACWERISVSEWSLYSYTSSRQSALTLRQGCPLSLPTRGRSAYSEPFH